MSGALFVCGFESGSGIDGQNDAGDGGVVVKGDDEKTALRTSQIKVQTEPFRQTKLLEWGRGG